MKDELKDNHEQFQKILKECEQLRWKKLNDYGLTYNEYGYLGILVKLGDKYGRLKRIYLTKKRNFESERDSLIDLINYAVMGIMELDKND